MVENITLKIGDITTANVDIIVNAANPSLLGGGGVDGAIHRAAGPELLQACQAIKSINGIRCPTGEAQITTAGQLNCRYVIHTVGPRYQPDPNPQILLERAYLNSLNLAIEYDCYTIAFPAISCGAYGYPIAEAANIAISTCKKAIYSNIKIIFYLYDQITFAIWNDISG